MKKTRPIAFVLTLCFAASLFAGCTEEREYPAALPQSTAQLPPDTGVSEAGFEAELYFVSEDGRKLYPEEQTLSYGVGETRAQAAINGLINGPESALLQPSLPAGLYLEHVELSLDVCNVYFTGEFPQTMREWLTARAAIAATVEAAEGIASVNVFFNGREPGYSGRPLGTISTVNDALDVYLNSTKQDYEVIPSEQQGEAVAYETHKATLYFADGTRKLVAAKTTELTYAVNATGEDMVRLLFGKLLAGDPTGSGLEPVLPADAVLYGVSMYNYGEMPAEPPAVLPTDDADAAVAADALPPEEPPAPQDGEKTFIIDIELEYGEELSEQDQKLMCAALTLTLTSYIPGADGVQITRKNTTESQALSEDYFERSDFIDMIGHGVTLYYPDGEGANLIGSTRIVREASAFDARVRLAELLTGPADPGVMYVGITAEDILSVYVSDGIAVVNWKEGFAQRLRDTIASPSGTLPGTRRELMYIYGVINTLCELPYVDRVWMCENGEKLGLITDIFLGNPLVASPGLIAED